MSALRGYQGGARGRFRVGVPVQLEVGVGDIGQRIGLDRQQLVGLRQRQRPLERHQRPFRLILRDQRAAFEERRCRIQPGRQACRAGPHLAQRFERTHGVARIDVHARHRQLDVGLARTPQVGMVLDQLQCAQKMLQRAVVLAHGAERGALERIEATLEFQAVEIAVATAKRFEQAKRGGRIVVFDQAIDAAEAGHGQSARIVRDCRQPDDLFVDVVRCAEIAAINIHPAQQEQIANPHRVGRAGDQRRAFPHQRGAPQRMILFGQRSDFVEARCRMRRGRRV